MTSTSCPADRKALFDKLSDGRYYFTINFVTERGYEIIRDGNSRISPFVFAVKISLVETLNMTDTELQGYIFRMASPILAAGTSAETIKLGQSRAEVEKILGAPDSVLDLGSKVIYRYRKIKVTFLEGKVADVE